MTTGLPGRPARPAAQLSQGRYPASPAVIWLVAALGVLAGLLLGLVIPVALSNPDPPGGATVVAVDVESRAADGNGR
ncbi:MAG: hypothetical protein KDB71_02445 [Mycobacterium sp.]|nr:hypothetical protein [Mycobacterium sp.]